MADLTDAEETALIEIMTASIKQAAFGHGPTGRIVKKVCSLCFLDLLIGDRQGYYKFDNSLIFDCATYYKISF